MPSRHKRNSQKPPYHGGIENRCVNNLSNASLAERRAVAHIIPVLCDALERIVRQNNYPTPQMTATATPKQSEAIACSPPLSITSSLNPNSPSFVPRGHNPCVKCGKVEKEENIIDKWCIMCLPIAAMSGAASLC